MTLRRKVQLSTGFTMLLLLLLLDLTFTGLLRRSSDMADIERMSKNLTHVDISIKGEQRALSATAGNWAFSDITYKYMKGGYDGYESTFLNRGVLKDIGISSMIFLNPNHSVKLFKDYSSAEDPSSPESEFRVIFGDAADKAIFSALGTDGTTGITLRDWEPILYSIKPILKSDMSGPAAGYLIVTRTISANMISDISLNLGVTFSIDPVSREKMGAAAASLKQTEIKLAKFRKGGAVTGRRLVRNHSGRPIFWIVEVAQKTNIEDNERGLQKLFLIFAGVVVLLSILLNIYINRRLTSRITRMCSDITKINNGDAKTVLLPHDNCKDEISDLKKAVNDAISFREYDREKKEKATNAGIMVYKRFSIAAERLLGKTLEDIASALTPGDDHLKDAVPRAAAVTRDFCASLDMNPNECLAVYNGALFSKVGMLGIQKELRSRDPEQMRPNELSEYHRYPLITKEFMERVKILRRSVQIPVSWTENWDGTGFPYAMKGTEIPFEARAYAIAYEWNELTRTWPCRVPLSDTEVMGKLRTMAGTRLDPDLVEQFIKFVQKS